MDFGIGDSMDLTTLIHDPYTLIMLISLLALVLMILVIVDFVISMHRGRKKSSEPSAPPNPPTPITTTDVDSLVKQIDLNKREISLVVQLPDIPDKLVIPFEKLPVLLNLTKPEPEMVESTTRNENQDNKSIDKRALALISKVSGLEFSVDGSKVYCNRHGWTDYIITEDGRIICKTGNETLYDPHVPKKLDVNVKKLSKELNEALRGINELQNKALITNFMQERDKEDVSSESEVEVEEESEGDDNE